MEWSGPCCSGFACILASGLLHFSAPLMIFSPHFCLLLSCFALQIPSFIYLQNWFHSSSDSSFPCFCGIRYIVVNLQFFHLPFFWLATLVTFFSAVVVLLLLGGILWVEIFVSYGLCLVGDFQCANPPALMF